MTDERRCERNISGYCPMHGQARPSCREPQVKPKNFIVSPAGAIAKRPGTRFVGIAIAMWPEALIYEKDGTWYLADGVRRHDVTDEGRTF